MAGLAVHDKSAADREFLKLLPLIAREVYDERNFVKKAINWALRNIGKRNQKLNAAAIACAEKIRAAANKRAGGERGGDPGARSARWVASDALRERCVRQGSGAAQGARDQADAQSVLREIGAAAAVVRKNLARLGITARSRCQALVLELSRAAAGR